MSEENVENFESNEPRYQIGPHPLGGIKLAVRDLEGGWHETRVDLPDATILHSHLGALITMAFQTMYAQAMRAAEQGSPGLFVPKGV